MFLSQLSIWDWFHRNIVISFHSQIALIFHLCIMEYEEAKSGKYLNMNIIMF